MGTLEKFDPSTAAQSWMNEKKRTPLPVSKSKHQEWFVGVFESAENKEKSYQNTKIQF